MTPSEARTVVPIPAELRKLVPLPTDANVTVKKQCPDVEEDTMPLIVTKARRTSWQTRQLAKALKGSSLSSTLSNDSNFILKYIAYRLDSPMHEQVRSPRRLVADGRGDCDCFAVFLATLLINQGIEFRFRIAQYADSGGDWSHIYIVVPKDQSFRGSLTDRSTYYVLDPVTNKHNFEATYTKKRDITMGLQFLDGFSSRPTLGRLGACTVEETVTPATLRKFVDTDLVILSGLVPTRQLLDQKFYPYEAKVDTASNTGYFVVLSPSGPVNVATVLTKAEAEQLESIMSSPVSTSSLTTNQVQKNTEAVEPKSSGTNWLGIILSGIGIVASMNPAKNQNAGAGLSGHKRALSKSAPKSKYQTLKM